LTAARRLCRCERKALFIVSAESAAVTFASTFPDAAPLAS
jgi:hypothetical protein